MAKKQLRGAGLVESYRYHSPSVPRAAIRRFARRIAQRFHPDKATDPGRDDRDQEGREGVAAAGLDDGNSVEASGVLVSGWSQRNQAAHHPAFFASGDLASHPVYYEQRRMSPALLEAISSSGMVAPAGVPSIDPKQSSGG
jgi:hypothetical protein